MAGWAGRWWRDVRHLLLGAGLGLAGYGLLVLTVLTAGLSLLGVGLPLFVRTVELTRGLADIQRRRVAEPVASPYPPMPSTLTRKVATIVRTSATWRDLGWLALPTQPVLALVEVALGLGALQGLLIPLLWLVLPADGFDYNGIRVDSPGTALIGLANGLLLAAFAAVTPPALVRVESRVTGWLLAPTAAARLTSRVQRLTETRSAAIDGSAVELRRIERDLHDGAQARLVALAMNLGLADAMFDDDPQLARDLLAEARTDAHQAMTELRTLVRGIHPPLLADRGLGGALEAVVHSNPVPVELDVHLHRRLSAPVESAAYFTLVEALANATKHSGAGRITVTVSDLGRTLALRVTDDGCGGADPIRGSGLRGLERRLAAFDGTVRVTSPAGGPTVVEAELPCGS